MIVPALRAPRTQVASSPPFIVIVAGPTILPGPAKLSDTWLASVDETRPKTRARAS